MNRRTFLAAPPLLNQAGRRLVSGYPVWDWERWKEITGATRPEMVSEQSGKGLLSDLLSQNGRPVRSFPEWEPRRAAIRRVLDAFLGKPPQSKPPLEPRVLERTQVAGYTRTRLVFQTEPGEFVPAYLLVPDKLTGRVPAVLCPHQTVQEGKLEPAGMAGNPRLHMAHELATRGYVAFTYDALCFGERHDPATGHYGEAMAFYKSHPGWSVMGKMAWDLSRAIDYLETLNFVDPARIGSIGHSHGGYTSFVAAALDKRLACAVSSCGFDTFRYDGNPWRWSVATALLPRLGFYISSPHLSNKSYGGMPDSETVQIPFDMHEVLALIAPRPLFLASSDDDNIFPNSGWSARQALARLEPLYGLAGAREKIGGYFFRGGHGFPPESAALCYGWLDRWLRA
ncbi:MAG TPA: alpha/beta hydrolase family protein [Bryobacteraceae bacterium]|nr:alpha/beta hydrolase family protein [Bryobacteraceae bacterium]